MAYLLVLLVSFVVLGLLGAYIAGEKHRSPGEGFLLGFLLGPIGLLIAVLMPTQAPAAPARRAQARGAARTVARRSVEGWQPPREVVEEQDAEAFRFLVGEDGDPARN